MSRTLARVGIVATCLLIVLTSLMTLEKLSVAEKQKERLVLLPVQGENLPQNELDLYQDAIKEGFSGQYEIFSGEQVQAKLQKFAVNSCTSDECLEKIAIAFNGHLVGRGFVDRDGKDSFLRIQIKDVFTDKDVYTKTSGCTDCTKTEIMQKLIALTGSSSASSSFVPEKLIPKQTKKEYDEEEELWRAIRDSTRVGDFRDYIKEYPKGRFLKAAEIRQSQLETKDVDNGKETAKNKRKKTTPAPVLEVPEKAVVEKKMTNSIGMTMVYIEPGTFMMGSPSSESGRYDNETLHQVTLTRGYYMQTTEVTQGQWRRVMVNNPSNFDNCGDDCPVEKVSWNDVQEFIRKLNSFEGHNRYRLPTEAEWEYACRAGSEGPYANGNSLDAMGWYDENSGSKTHTVAQKKANAWGLYDMHGNVWELCQDGYGDYSSGSVSDPEGSSGSDRVLRGGSWSFFARFCRSASRSGLFPGGRIISFGFRLALSPGQ